MYDLRFACIAKYLVIIVILLSSDIYFPKRRKLDRIKQRMYSICLESWGRFMIFSEWLQKKKGKETSTKLSLITGNVSYSYVEFTSSALPYDVDRQTGH